MNRSDSGRSPGEIALVVGTRPELIKVAPVVRALRRRSVPHKLIYTGQHTSADMRDIFFEELGLRVPDFDLKVGGAPPGVQHGKIVIALDELLSALRPAYVVVQGDTTSTLAAAISAVKLEIPVAHVEAGLRCDDRTLPEETNRLLVGQIATLHLCPTQHQVERLAREGIATGVHVVGNTVVDACRTFAPDDEGLAKILAKHGLTRHRYLLVSIHRAGNVDDLVRLRGLMEALRLVGTTLGMPVVIPVHPRTRKRLAEAGIEDIVATAPFVKMPPIGYSEMLGLIRGSACVLSDSGGLQEESCTMHVPCVTLRPNTERPETITVGANVLFPGTDGAELLAIVRDKCAQPRTWANPYGNGDAGERIVDILLGKVG
jgi:UDP-N-acetylglucosamine 2-epimerase (non-hydrolysing)